MGLTAWREKLNAAIAPAETDDSSSCTCVSKHSFGLICCLLAFVLLLAVRQQRRGVWCALTQQPRNDRSNAEDLKGIAASQNVRDRGDSVAHPELCDELVCRVREPGGSRCEARVMVLCLKFVR